MNEPETPSPEESPFLGFYSQAIIGLICGLGISALAAVLPLWWPNAGFVLWIVVFASSWIVLLQLIRRQLNGMILGLLIGTAVGYFVIGRLFHFPGLG